MEFYDSFQALTHPVWAQRLLVSCNKNVVLHIRTLSGKIQPRVLEVGPGKGYFHQALRIVCPESRYVAVDRNRALLTALGAEQVIHAGIPKLPDFPELFDVVYAAFVIEHLSDGRALHEFLSDCRRVLDAGGLVALVAPDSLKQKMEFWNMDYTHTYPTTKRNVAMALRDAGFSIVATIDVSGLLTHPFFTNRVLYRLTRALLFFYRYRFLSALSYPLHRTDAADLNNIWYRFHCLAKQPTFMIVARSPRHAGGPEA